MLYLFFLVGFLLRILLIPSPGFKADMAYWKAWGLAIVDKGILWVAQNTNYNYPPGFAYVLYIVNKLYAMIRNPYIIADYWLDTNIYYLAIFKIIPIFSDIGVVFILYKIARKLNYKRAVILMLFYFLSPAVLFDGPLWGQVDQFGLFLFLIAIYLLLKDRITLSSIVFTASCLMKFQNIIFIPLFFLYIYKKYSLADLAKSMAVAFVTFIIIDAPFLLAHDFSTLLRLLTINSDWFPWYSLNAFNIWWIASGASGMQLSDKNLVFGITAAKQIGLYFFILAYFIAAVSLFFSKTENLFKNFIFACAFVVFAFFHLLTESHERYLFHLMGLLPLCIMLIEEKKRKPLFMFSLFFSAIFFLNLYIAFGFNYPDVIFWPQILSQHAKGLSLFIAFVQIAVFIYFVIFYMREAIIENHKYILMAIVLIFGAIFYQNLAYFTGNPIPLTKIAPISKSQDYLEPIYNKNLNSKISPTSFDRFSSNYYFYQNGIASHANSDIVYSLDGKFSRLKTDYGLDTEAKGEAAMYFIIEGDGRELFRSGKKGKFENPSHVEVNIKGVDKLTLRIRKAQESIYGAHGDWLNPMIIR